jgi:hypothetical protein
MDLLPLTTALFPTAIELLVLSLTLIELPIAVK